MRKLVVTLAVMLGACGDATIGTGNPDAPLAVVVDARAFPDAFTPCNLPAAPPCPGGTRCVNGTCQTDECLKVVGDGGSVCPAGDGCNIACVPLTDPCNGVTCGNQETCVGGKCVPGCFSPSKCLNKVCGPGQFCSNGNCVDITPCASECPAGTVCNIFCRPLGPCEGVQCADNEICAVVAGVGTCVTNLCFDKTCAPTFVCSNGDCIPTCGCNPPCQSFETCINNHCVCTPSCPPNAVCGQNDGCNGKCNGSCATAGETCNNGTCQCVPNCPVTAKCGDSDGCNGKCNGSCAADDPQKVCQSGTCVCTNQTCNGDCCAASQKCFNNACCTPVCTGLNAHCGSDDGCGGKCDVEDCGSGMTCDNTTRMCVCKTSLCGGTCCADGQVCDPTNNTCCTRNCNNNDSACNDAETSCGMVCNGCPANQTCDQTTDMCKCSFVTCNGACCTNGQQCRTDTNPDRCCNPSCSGKTCGQLNDCGQKCTNCPANETCNTTTDMCECPTALCNGVCCGAGTACKAGVCCPTARQCPDENKCCASGETCFEDTSGADTCCLASRWCVDSKQCCPSDKPHCLNDGDGMASNDVCCGNGQFLCNGACCPNGNTCTLDGQCLSVCNPPCGCFQICQGGQCVDYVCNKPCGCQCCGEGQECKPDGVTCGPLG